MLVEDAHHNHPLYVTGCLNGYRARRMLIDAFSSVNVVPVHTLRAIGIEDTRDKSIVMEIFDFNANVSQTLGSWMLQVEVRPYNLKVEFWIMQATPCIMFCWASH
uniref:Uncharacterized protein n=1 Tax=Nelumbo nucifera TaxID=4432 RepID=A0A822Y245_NELNU|nr:TPA_asm: hypothetical protein HUJ06_026833 [Nelumbo nucifera]